MDIRGFMPPRFCKKLRIGVNIPCAPNLYCPQENCIDLNSGPGAVVQETISVRIKLAGGLYYLRLMKYP